MKKIYETDPYLAPYKEAIEKRHERILEERDKIALDGSLADGLNNHLYYGLQCVESLFCEGFSRTVYFGFSESDTCGQDCQDDIYRDC